MDSDLAGLYGLSESNRWTICPDSAVLAPESREPCKPRAPSLSASESSSPEQPRQLDLKPSCPSRPIGFWWLQYTEAARDDSDSVGDCRWRDGPGHSDTIRLGILNLGVLSWNKARVYWGNLYIGLSLTGFSTVLMLQSGLWSSGSTYLGYLLSKEPHCIGVAIILCSPSSSFGSKGFGSKGSRLLVLGSARCSDKCKKNVKSESVGILKVHYSLLKAICNNKDPQVRQKVALDSVPRWESCLCTLSIH